jgi:predicted RNA binding protein YcfA (HicA-like mRNA interferase family)
MTDTGRGATIERDTLGSADDAGEGARGDQDRRGGWLVPIGTKGDHRQYKHPTKPGKVTIPGASSDELPPGTWNSIQRQAGLK